jgi:riboflavin synthase
MSPPQSQKGLQHIMFTGIIEEVGQIKGVDLIAGTRRLHISAKDILAGLRIGDSVAVSGVCLTVIDLYEQGFSADLSSETWELTSFSRLQAGSLINLELPLKADGRFGGHLVQGHTHATGKFLHLSPVPGAQDLQLHIEVPPDIARALVSKCSIAIEGISLTVARLAEDVLTVAVIPHTLHATNLPSLKPGDPVNIETDVMMSHLAKWSIAENTRASRPIAASVPANRFRYAIVVSEFNSFITDRLLSGAMRTLESHQVPSVDIHVVHVPGAYEIPFMAKLLAQSGQFDAIICLGCLIRGGTLHYEVIAHEASRGIGQSALETGIPHSFGVLTCDTQEQAIDRVGMKAGNKGSEAALAAIQMAGLKHRLQSGKAIPRLVPATAS